MWWLLLPLVVSAALAVKTWRRYNRRRDERARRDHIRAIMAAQGALWASHLGGAQREPLPSWRAAPFNVPAHPPTRAHGAVRTAVSPEGGLIAPTRARHAA